MSNIFKNGKLYKFTPDSHGMFMFILGAPWEEERQHFKFKKEYYMILIGMRESSGIQSFIFLYRNVLLESYITECLEPVNC